MWERARTSTTGRRERERAGPFALPAVSQAKRDSSGLSSCGQLWHVIKTLYL